MASSVAAAKRARRPAGRAAKPRLSIAVVNYNSGYRLRQCLDAIRRFPPSCPYEVVVVDNASSDGSADFLREAVPPHVRVHFSPVNLLFTGGVNLAHAEARGDLFMIMNPDIVTLEGSLDALVRHMDEDPSVGAIGGYTLTKHLEFEKYINRFPTPYALFLTHFRKTAPKTKEKAAYKRYHMVGEDFSAPREVPQPAGGCFVVRSSLFEGRLLDPDLGIYWSDVELARKVGRAGGRILLFPDARFIHDHNHAPKPPNRRYLLINLDFFVGSNVYFRAYEGFWAALRLRALIVFGLLTSILLVRLLKTLRGQEPWEVWRTRVGILWNYLRGRNKLLEEARQAARALEDPTYSRLLSR